MKMVRAKYLKVGDEVADWSQKEKKTVYKIVYRTVLNLLNNRIDIFFWDGSSDSFSFGDIVTIKDEYETLGINLNKNEVHCINCFEYNRCTKSISADGCKKFTFKDGNCHSFNSNSQCKYIEYGCKGCSKGSSEIKFIVPATLRALAESTPFNHRGITEALKNMSELSEFVDYNKEPKSLNHPNCRCVVTEIGTLPKEYSRLLDYLYGINKVEFFTKKDRTTTVVHFPKGDRLAVRQSKDDVNDLEFAILYAYFLYHSGLTKTQAKKRLSKLHKDNLNTMWKGEFIQREKEYLYGYLMNKTGKDKITSIEYVKGLIGESC